MTPLSSAHFERLIRMYGSAPINEYFRPTLRFPREGDAEIELDVRPDFFHAAHAMHGAVYFKALDDATFFAAQSLLTDCFVLTSTFHLCLLRPVTGGHLVARGKVVSRSKRVYIADGVLSNEDGKEVARGTGTFMPSTTVLGPALGYA